MIDPVVGLDHTTHAADQVTLYTTRMCTNSTVVLVTRDEFVQIRLQVTTIISLSVWGI